VSDEGIVPTLLSCVGGGNLGKRLKSGRGESTEGGSHRRKKNATKKYSIVGPEKTLIMQLRRCDKKEEKLAAEKKNGEE